MIYINFDDIVNNTKVLSIKKNKNGSIILSFSTFDKDLINRILNNMNNIRMNIGGMHVDFNLKGYSRNNHVYSFTLVYSSFQNMMVTRTIVFNTINQNVKDMYDRSFIYYPYVTDFQDPDKVVFLKVVENEYGINGWRVSEILHVLSRNLDVDINLINIPPSFDYKLKYFRVSEGQNLLNILSSLFKHITFVVYRIEDEIYIRNSLYFRKPSYINFEVCENHTISEYFNIDLIVVKGERSEPRYVIPPEPEIIEINDILYGGRRKIQFNKFGREFIELVREEELTSYIERVNTEQQIP